MITYGEGVGLNTCTSSHSYSISKPNQDTWSGMGVYSASFCIVVLLKRPFIYCLHDQNKLKTTTVLTHNNDNNNNIFYISIIKLLWILWGLFKDKCAVNIWYWDSNLTCGADSECSQGPAESQHASVLWAEPLQAVLHQLSQRLRQVLQALLQLGRKHRSRFHTWTPDNDVQSCLFLNITCN